MAKKDYYEVLGVPRNASDEEIKSAYKRLVKEWHPDRQPEERKKLAEQKFKEIQEAYEVLSDPQKRAMYDRFGYVGEGAPYAYERSAGTGGFNFEDLIRDFFNDDIFNIFFGTERSGTTATGTARARRAPRRGEDVHVSIDLTLADVFSGRDVTVEYDRLEACERCEGLGVEPGSRSVHCSKCRGTGVVREERRTPFGVFINQYTCDQCGGEGVVPGEVCHLCRGQGRIKKRTKLTLSVQPGVEDGQVLKFPKKGHAGLYGGDYGDLYVKVNVQKSSGFTREGDDIIVEVPVDYVTAILGGTVTVRLPNGESVVVEVPAGTQPNENIVLRNKGVPNFRTGRRGNLVVRVRVDIPKRVSKRERELLSEIAKIRGVEG